MTLGVDFQVITVSLFCIQTGIRSALLCACAEVGVAALPSLWLVVLFSPQSGARSEVVKLEMCYGSMSTLTSVPGHHQLHVLLPELWRVCIP